MNGLLKIKSSHLLGIYGSGEHGSDFSLIVQIGKDKKDLDDLRQHGEDRKVLDDSWHLIIKITIFPSIVQLGVCKQVLVDPTKFVLYLHIEESCLLYCLWVLLFCCNVNKYKEGFNCADRFTRTQYFTNILLNVTEILCGFPFLCWVCILFHLMPWIVENHCYWFNNNHCKDFKKRVLPVLTDLQHLNLHSFINGAFWFMSCKY